jgi:hypothetical protein
MNSSGHLPVSEKAARRVRKTKSHHRKTRGRGRNSHNGTGRAEKEPQPAAIGSLTRTKALLLAALRVWELKHRIGE